MDAATTDVLVLPMNWTMLPMNKDKTNWARNSILLTRATSVPNPRMLEPFCWLDLLNWKKIKYTNCSWKQNTSYTSDHHSVT